MRKWNKSTRLFLLAGVGTSLGVACSSADADSASFGGPVPTDTGSDVIGDGDNSGTTGSSVPPEQELEASFRAPVVSGHYLWTANPESDRIARISADSLEVELYEGGHGPTFLSALPKGTTSGGALIINDLSHDASIFLLNDQGEVESSDRFEVQDGASAWAVSRKGKYAVAWSKFGDSSLPGVDGHQDMTLFDFSKDSVETWMLAVGYRPSEVFIDRAETRAYVVCDPGISVISLDDRKVEREIFLPESNLVGSRDIEFSPDGRLALSRSQGSSDILLIDTRTGKTKTLTLPGVVTDLDMSLDGSLAIAVVRGELNTDSGGMGGGGGHGGADPGNDEGLSVVAIIDPKTAFDTPSFDAVTTEEIVGSVVIADDASQAVLYTNASDNTHLSIFDPDTLDFRVVDLKAPARAAFLAEDGSFAVALMAPPPGSKKSGAFALVPVAEDLPPRIEGTNNQPEYVSVSTQARVALITTSADAEGRAEAYLAQFPSLLLDRVALPSRPLATGLVPDAQRGFVAQEHPEGRITFVDLETAQETTVTGFELAAKVVD